MVPWGLHGSTESKLSRVLLDAKTDVKAAGRFMVSFWPPDGSTTLAAHGVHFSLFFLEGQTKDLGIYETSTESWSQVLLHSHCAPQGYSSSKALVPRRLAVELASLLIAAALEQSVFEPFAPRIVVVWFLPWRPTLPSRHVYCTRMLGTFALNRSATPLPLASLFVAFLAVR